MASIAVFVALGGGAYAAVSASIPDQFHVIHGCYKKKKGNLRLISSGRCSRSEREIVFNQRGRAGTQGPRGVQGNRGVAGASGSAGTKGEQGLQGPRGPGATTFTTTLSQPTAPTSLLKLDNGITIEGACGPSNVEVFASSSTGEANVQASGTKYSGEMPLPVHINNNGTDVGAGAGTEADIDVVARASATGKFAHIDIHGSAGTPCTFWGMVIPSG
jgi:hypothetical protein